MAEARFCGNCGEPLGVEVDREEIRQLAQGFLPPAEFNKIAAAVEGERDHSHEYTTTLVQESAWRALTDFRYVTDWDALDNSDVIRPPEDGEEKASVLKIDRLIGLISILYASAPPTLLMILLANEVAFQRDLNDDQEVDAAVFIDGERITEPVPEYMEELRDH
jgi:hypothetical protein